MAISKIKLDGKTLIDLTNDTVESGLMLQYKADGSTKVTAHNANGEIITGTIPRKSSSDLTFNGATVTVPSGYYATDATKTIGSGVISAGDSALTDGTITPDVLWDSENHQFYYQGSGQVTGTAHAKVTTPGYVDNTKNASKPLSAYVWATGEVPTISLSSSFIGDTSAKTPVIEQQSVSISGVTDAASGGQTTTAPSSGVYVAIKSAANTSKISSDVGVVTSGYGTADHFGESGAAEAYVGAASSAKTYVPIKTTSATVSGPTVSYGSGWITSGSKTVASGSITANSSTISGDTFTPTINYSSSSGKFYFGGSGTATGEAVASVSVDGYVTTGTSAKKDLSAEVSADGDLAVVSLSDSFSGTDTPQKPAIAKESISIIGVVDAASGSATTTTPTSGVYVAVKSPANTGTITGNPAVKSAGYGNTEHYTVQTTAEATVGAAASDMTYVPIKTTSATLSGPTVSYGTGWITGGSKTVASGTITNNTSGGTSTDTINAGSQIKIGTGYYGSDLYYTAEAYPTLSGNAVTANVLSGKTFYSNSYTKRTGVMLNRAGWSSSVGYGQSVKIPEGYHDGTKSVSSSVSAGAVSAADSTITGASFTPTLTYDETNNRFNFGGSADVTGTAHAKITSDGYLTSGSDTSKDLSATVNATGYVSKISLTAGTTGTLTTKPSISKKDVEISGVIDASDGDATTTAPVTGVYVAVQSAANTGTLTINPSVASNGYGTKSYYGATAVEKTVGASASDKTYVPIKTTSATVSGPTVSYGPGWIKGGSKTVASGAAGTPSISASTVTNFSRTYTPTCTSSTGWITGATVSGASITVSPSDLGLTNRDSLTKSGGTVYLASKSWNSATLTATVTPTDLGLTKVTALSVSGKTVTMPANSYTEDAATGTVADGSVTLSKTQLTVSPSVTPTAVASATSASISLGSKTVTQPTSGRYISVTGGNSLTTGGSISGTSCDVTKAEGYISAGTLNVYSSAAATANANSTTVYYPVASASFEASGASIKTKSGGAGWVDGNTTVGTVASGSVALSDSALSVSPSVTPPATASATGSSVILGTVTETQPSSGRYITVTGGNSSAIGGATSGESCTVTKTAGYISAGTSTVTSSAKATANASSKTVYYPIASANFESSGASIKTKSGGAGWVDENTIVGTVSTGVISAADSTMGNNSFTPTLTYDSTNTRFNYGGSATCSGTAYAKITTSGYLTSGTQSTKSLSGTVSATGYLTRVVLNGTLTGTTSAKTPAIGRVSRPSGDTWTDAASGSSTTTKPTSGIYVAVQSPANTGTIKANPSVKTGGYGTSDYFGISTAAEATVGAAASAVTYVPINAGGITNNTSGGTSSGTINRGKQIKIGAGYYASDLYYTAQSNSGQKTITSSGSTTVDGYTTAYVAGGTITNNTSGGTSSGTITAGSQIKIGAGYYGSDYYYTAASNPTLSGNAAVGSVLSGSTFYSNSYTKQTGTMTNKGAWTGSVGYGGSLAVPAGYHNGNGYVSCSVTAGSAGTPSVSVGGSSSSYTVACTPTCTSTTGYITGATATGTAVNIGPSTLGLSLKSSLSVSGRTVSLAAGSYCTSALSASVAAGAMSESQTFTTTTTYPPIIQTIGYIDTKYYLQSLSVSASQSFDNMYFDGSTTSVTRTVALNRNKCAATLLNVSSSSTQVCFKAGAASTLRACGCLNLTGTGYPGTCSYLGTSYSNIGGSFSAASQGMVILVKNVKSSACNLTIGDGTVGLNDTEIVNATDRLTVSIPAYACAVVKVYRATTSQLRFAVEIPSTY